VAQPVQTMYYPQLLNAIDEAEALVKLRSSQWMVQQKHDGVRHMLLQKGGIQTAINKRGVQVTPEPKVIAMLSRCQYDFLVDGELVGEKYFIFDLLELNKIDLRPMPYESRYGILKSLMEGKMPGYAKLASESRVLVESPIHGSTHKENYIQTLKAAGAEGLVFKKASSVYQSGRPSSGGDHLKFKFVATASFIVTAQNTARSVAVALLDAQGVEVPVGNCTIPANKAVPPVGALVEIQYLYAFRGGSIYQPVYLTQRDDITREECVLTQLKYKGEGTDTEEDIELTPPVV